MEIDFKEKPYTGQIQERCDFAGIMLIIMHSVVFSVFFKEFNGELAHMFSVSK